MIIRKITCRSILSRSKIPDVDYAINPYVGCGHGCVYCYAVFMKRFTDHREPWGQFVDIKRNGPQQLLRDLKRAKSGQILLSSVTDPYQPAEKRYGITRDCLEVLHQVRLPVSILTKSILVLRDLDLLERMKSVDVGLTITTLNEEVRRNFEPRSSPVEDRFNAIRRLASEGVPTWIFFGPVLPHFSDGEDVLEEFFQRAEACGAQYVYVDRMNLYPNVWERVQAVLKRRYPKVMDYYRKVREDRDSYSEFLRGRIRKAIRRCSIQCRIVF
ncbi:MAG: radical SAM protein [Gemmatimonadota bacterium]|nr:MAG: radical SAM protein [Gemmatimonadota bacterium]